MANGPLHGPPNAPGLPPAYYLTRAIVCLIVGAALILHETVVDTNPPGLVVIVVGLALMGFAPSDILEFMKESDAMATTPLRQAIIAQADWGIHNQPTIHYAQTRPIPLRQYKDHRVPLTTDCSGYVTCCYYAAGAPDPNGLGYSGQGFTGSLLGHLPKIAKKDAEPGDVVVFGPGDGDHAVILLDPGTVNDPRVASHGTEADPKVQPLSIEVNSHPPPVTFLRGVPPQKAGPVKTWNVVNGSGMLLGEKIKHPVRWALAHPKAFRKWWDVSFKRQT